MRICRRQRREVPEQQNLSKNGSKVNLKFKIGTDIEIFILNHLSFVLETDGSFLV